MPTFSTSALALLAMQADSTLVTENVQISLPEVSIALPVEPTPAEYLLKAESGDLEAQRNVMYWYRLGVHGFEQNDTEYTKWRIRLAEQGDVDSQKSIAASCTYGWDGFERNVEEAIKWYMRAVAQGDLKSLKDIAYLYEQEKRYEEAFTFYNQAVEQGYEDALINLIFLCHLAGQRYYYGIDVEKNIDEAIKWYLRASEKGSASGQSSLGYIYYTEKKEIEEAIKWFRIAAENWEKSAFGSLGELLYFEKKEIEEGLIWLRRSANQDDYLSSIILLNHKCLFVPQQFQEAIDESLSITPYSEKLFATIDELYKNHSQALLSHWWELLNSSDVDIVRDISNIIVLGLSLPQEHVHFQTALEQLTVLNQSITDPQSPWKIWRDLLEKRQVAVNLDDEMPVIEIAGHHVRLKPSVLETWVRAHQIAPVLEGVEVQQAKSLLIDMIREVITTVLETDNDFVKGVCGVQGELNDLAHQSLYLKNLIGESLGLLHKVSFDYYTRSLYEDLLEKSKEDLLRAFYVYVNRGFDVAIQHKINQAVMSSNAYLLLSELTSAWTVNEGENKVITSQGVVELLLAIGVL